MCSGYHGCVRLVFYWCSLVYIGFIGVHVVVLCVYNKCILVIIKVQWCSFVFMCVKLCVMVFNGLIVLHWFSVLSISYQLLLCVFNCCFLCVLYCVSLVFSSFQLFLCVCSCVYWLTVVCVGLHCFMVMLYWV